MPNTIHSGTIEAPNAFHINVLIFEIRWFLRARFHVTSIRTCVQLRPYNAIAFSAPIAVFVFVSLPAIWSVRFFAPSFGYAAIFASEKRVKITYME